MGRILDTENDGMVYAAGCKSPRARPGKFCFPVGVGTHPGHSGKGSDASTGVSIWARATWASLVLALSFSRCISSFTGSSISYKAAWESDVR